jgi:hypothetical protein
MYIKVRSPTQSQKTTNGGRQSCQLIGQFVCTLDQTHCIWDQSERRGTAEVHTSISTLVILKQMADSLNGDINIELLSPKG